MEEVLDTAPLFLLLFILEEYDMDKSENIFEENKSIVEEFMKITEKFVNEVDISSLPVPLQLQLASANQKMLVVCKMLNRTAMDEINLMRCAIVYNAVTKDKE